MALSMGVTRRKRMTDSPLRGVSTRVSCSAVLFLLTFRSLGAAQTSPPPPPLAPAPAPDDVLTLDNGPVPDSDILVFSPPPSPPPTPPSPPPADVSIAPAPGPDGGPLTPYPAPAPSINEPSGPPNTDTKSTELPSGYIFIDCGESEQPSNDLFKAANSVPKNLGNYTIASFSDTTVGNISTQQYPKLTDAERTLRSLPTSGACYKVKLLSKDSRWTVRLGTGYYNYDQLSNYPNFTVSINGMIVDQIALADWEVKELYDVVGTVPGGGGPGRIHYTEYVFTVNVSVAEVCFNSVEGSTARPVVSSIELLPTYLWEVDAVLPGITYTLALKGRFKLGGPAVPVNLDPVRRRWKAQSTNTLVYFNSSGKAKPKYKNITSTSPDNQPDLWGNDPLPVPLFLDALSGGELDSEVPGTPTKMLGIRMHYFPYSSANHLFAKLYFAEVDDQVQGPGQRVFNISFGAVVDRPDLGTEPLLVQYIWPPQDYAFNYDIWFSANGTNLANTAPFFGCHPDPVPYRTNLSLIMLLTSYSSPLPPIISGVEFWEILAGPVFDTCAPVTNETLYNNVAAQYPSIVYPSSASGLSAGAIFGIVLASIAGVAVITALVVWLVRRRSESRRASSFQRFRSDGFA